MIDLLYKRSESLNRRTPELDYLGEPFSLAPQVYRPLHGEESVLGLLGAEDRVLDLGCGSGIITVLMARRVRSVVATDLSPAAVACTRANVEAKGLANVTVREGDMFSAVSGPFDKIVANPPWLFFLSPTSQERAWGTSRTYLPTLFGEGRTQLADSAEARILAFFPRQFASVISGTAAQAGFRLVRTHSHGERASFGMRVKYFQVWFDPAWFEFARH
jgi:SAM-dependent methyltransferase